MKKQIMIHSLAVLLLVDQAFAQSGSFLVRTVGSSSAEFESYLKASATTSYVDWILYSAKNHIAKASDLSKALEVCITDPTGAVPYFEKAIAEIQSTWMSEADRSLLGSIYKKVSDLNLPQRQKDEYSRRFTNFRMLHSPASAEPMRSTISPFFLKEVQITLEKIKRLKGTEDAMILVNSEPLAQVLKRGLPEGSHQWALLSNTYSPLLFVGTWNDFQTVLFAEQSLKPLAEGSCQNAQITSSDFEVQTSARVFVSKDCLPKVTQPSLSEQGGAHHLTEELPAVETENKWKWVVPVAVFVTAGLVYSLRGKHINVKAPALR